MRPRRIHLLVEGRTEETIARDVFQPFLAGLGCAVSLSVVLTKRPAGPATAPSKRLLTHYPAYDKPLDGPLAVCELGLGKLREQCPHLDQWLARLETIVVPEGLTPAG
jgi:hypothetical protein